MAEATVTFLLEKVAQVLKTYVDLISGAENELEQLESDLSLLQTFLVEAGRKQKKEEQFRELERQIREVVYDAEDTIDRCLTEAAEEAAQKRKFQPKALWTRSKKVNLAKKVKDIRVDKVKPMFDKARREFAEMEIGDGVVKNPAKVQLIREHNVVGFEDEQAEIIGYLNQETDVLDVVSIVGMPGLGKTTLAWKIFHDKAIQFNFPIRIWVYVSEDFNLKDLLLKILKELSHVDKSSEDVQELAKTVRSYLQDREFLLVMDDVWTISAWNEIKNILPPENLKSKVLITTRLKNVGIHASPSRRHHDLRFLTNDESWELLQYEVFGRLHHCPDELKETGKNIASKCDGLPLTIVVIGGVLVDNLFIEDKAKTQNAWKNVSNNVSTYFTKDTNEEDNKEKRLVDAVEMSYRNLNDEMRNCFLYLGVFPEDYQIPAQTLIHLWIAEGFIPNGGGSLEERAEGNLNGLINRNLVIIVDRNSRGGAKTCKVHDIIRVFCISKAGKENFFQEIKMTGKDSFDPPVTDKGNYRRLCIHSQISKFLSQKMLNGPKVRSFVCCSKEKFTLKKNYITFIPQAFPFLRVLESQSFEFTYFHPRFAGLKQLRYITLSFDKLDNLPDSISELWNLETLLINTTSETLEIKANIWKLTKLRHLKTQAAIHLVVQGEPNQACKVLQTLTRVAPESCTEEVFTRAPNIKKLGIRGDLATLLDGNHSLDTLNLLESLTMVNELKNSPASENPLRGFPRSKFFPSKLKRLSLSSTYMEWTHMSTLGEINSLQVLKLKDNAFQGSLWDADGHRFRALHFLLISNSMLENWKASTTDFPVLRCLVLMNCKRLGKLPEETLVESLHKLSMDGHIGNSAVESAKRIKAKKEQMQRDQKQDLWSGFELKLGPRFQ